MLIRTIKRLFHLIFAKADTRVSYYINSLCICKKYRFYALGLIISRRLQRRYGIFVPYNAHFDKSLVLRHPTGVIIGEGADIGRNVVIFQNVTIGRSDTDVSKYPSIGDDCIIYAGAVILGSITIGKNCIIGANAVVITDMPDDSIAVGVPARVILKKRADDPIGSLREADAVTTTS